jgi:hypothetical protein
MHTLQDLDPTSTLLGSSPVHTIANTEELSVGTLACRDYAVLESLADLFLDEAGRERVL